MLEVRPTHRMAALMALTLLIVTATTGALLTAAGREPTGLQLILSPHPDDELLAWPAIEDDPEHVHRDRNVNPGRGDQ